MGFYTRKQSTGSSFVVSPGFESCPAAHPLVTSLALSELLLPLMERELAPWMGRHEDLRVAIGLLLQTELSDHRLGAISKSGLALFLHPLIPSPLRQGPKCPG